MFDDIFDADYFDDDYGDYDIGEEDVGIFDDDYFNDATEGGNPYNKWQKNAYMAKLGQREINPDKKVNINDPGYRVHVSNGRMVNYGNRPKRTENNIKSSRDAENARLYDHGAGGYKKYAEIKRYLGHTPNTKDYIANGRKPY